MKHFEKHSLEEILNLTNAGYSHPAVVNGKLVGCKEMNCKNCEINTNSVRKTCGLQFIEWLYSEVPEDTSEGDQVNHPSHYTDGKIEVIDYIEDKGFGFCLGNAIKYISRAGKKDQNKEVEDLQKAIWYINRKIKQICKEESEDEEADD